MSELESLSTTDESVLSDLGKGQEILPHEDNDELDHSFLLGHTDESARSKPQQDGQDIFSLDVMAGSKGVALFCIITICLCMSACSFLMLYQFDVAESSRSASTVGTKWTDSSTPTFESSYNNVCEASNRSESLPLGQRVFAYQIHVIQNLVHASLVGSAAVVAAVRGDSLWMFYVRNVAFFFIPVGSVYFFLDIRSVFIGETTLMDHICRLPLSFLSALAGVVAFTVYTPIFLRIRRRICERCNAGFQTDPKTCYPLYLAENMVEANLATVIYRCATVVQVVGWVYYATTIIEWFSKQSSCFSTGLGVGNDEQNAMTDLQAFEMAYSSGSHQALLIALCFLAATYPRDIASVGGALLTSSWRSLVAVGSLLHLLNDTEVDPPVMSCVNEAVEVCCMLPIVMASSILVYRILHRRDHCHANSLESSIEVVKPEGNIRYHCASLTQISRSPRFSVEQRKGAQLLRNGTLLLLLELTAECIVMLRYNRIGTDMTHEVYKWGMHVCVMHIFCAVMCVETPFIYHKGRKLLIAACPSGSLVALWQFSTVFRHTPDIRKDTFGQVAACLLMLRALSGFTQLAGLFQLTTLQPTVSESFSNTRSVASDKNTMIKTRLKQLRLVLWGLYVPSMAVYIFAFSFLGNCHPPMISSSIISLACSESASTALSLAQNWPGMGLIFHYGMIIVIFAANGAQEEIPTYKPSLNIASLFSVHVSILIVAHLCWDVVQSDFWSILSVGDVGRRLLVLLWMLVSLVLWFFCERVLDVRLDPI